MPVIQLSLLVIVGAQLDFTGIPQNLVCMQFDNLARIHCMFCNCNQVADLRIYPQLFGQFPAQSCRGVQTQPNPTPRPQNHQKL